MQPQALPTLFSCGSQMEHFIMQHEVCTGPALPLGRLRRGWNGGKPPACPLAQTSNVPLSGFPGKKSPPKKHQAQREVMEGGHQR
jgi:hypothetical protein